LLHKWHPGYGDVRESAIRASYDVAVDKKLITRLVGSSATVMVGGAAIMITVLAASAAGDLPAARSGGKTAAPVSAAASAVQPASRAIPAAALQLVAAPAAPGGPNAAAQTGGVIRASMSPAQDEPLAGPVSKTDTEQAPRRLSNQELSQLRQDIRRAGEEVYEPYRQQHH